MIATARDLTQQLCHHVFLGLRAQDADAALAAVAGVAEQVRPGVDAAGLVAELLLGADQRRATHRAHGDPAGE